MATGSTNYSININTGQALAALTQLQGGVTSLGGALGRIPGGAAFTPIIAGAAAAAAAVAALGAALVKGLNVNAEIETARLGIKSLVLALTEVRDATGNKAVGEQQIQIAGQIADEQVKKLRLAGLQTAATFQQLMGAFQQGIGAGSSAGLNLDQIRELTVGIVQAASAIGLPMEQLNQEVRSLLAGDITADSSVAKALGITNAQVKAWQQSGKFVEEMNKRLEAFKRIGPEAATTWTATLSNMSDAVSLFLGTVTEGAFSRLKKSLQGVFNGLFDEKAVGISEQFQGLADVASTVFSAIGNFLADALEGGIKLAQELSGWFSENKETTAQWGDALGAIWGTLKSLVGDAFKLVGAIIKWGAESGVFTAVLQAVALNLAFIKDAVKGLSGGFAIVGAVIADAIGTPLRKVGFFIADLLAKLPGVGEALSKSVRAIATAIPENGEGLMNYAAGVVSDIMSGNTEVNKTLAALRSAQKVREDQNEFDRESRKNRTDNTKTAGGTTTPKKAPPDPKLAEQLRMSLQQLAEARLAAAKTVSESERKVEEAALDERLASQLVKYTDYLRKKATLDKAALDDQIEAAKLAQKQIEVNIKAEADPAKKNKLIGDLEKIKAQITALENGKVVIDTKLRVDEVQFARDIASLRVDIRANILDAKGNTLEASLARLAQETETLLRDKRVQEDPELQALVRQQSDAKAAKLRFDDKSTQVGRTSADLAATERELQNAVALGTLTRTEAEQKLNAERERALQLLREQIDAAEALAVATGNPEQLAAVRQFRIEMQGIQVQANAAGTELRNGFLGDLKSGFEDLLQKGKSLKDVLRDIAIKSLTRVADKQLDGLLDGLQKAGGDGLTKFFNDLGKGTGEGILDAMQSGWDAIKKLFSGLADMLTNALSGLFGGSGSSGGGGLLGGLGEAISSMAGYATGGEIDGPGTGTSDSILARLSKGEFVVKAAAVRSVGVNTLHHINSLGKLPGFASGGGWGLPAMQAAGGGGQTSYNWQNQVVIDSGHVLRALVNEPGFNRHIVGVIGDNKKAVQGAWG